MAGKFNFVITADNNPALRAIRSVNRELYKINKPFRDIAGSLRAFGRESGFSQLIGAFKGTADAASDVASKIGSILTPLIAVTGFGSIAAVMGMADHWANLSQTIGMTKFQTAMSGKEVQTWINAGREFGLTTEDMAGGLDSFVVAMRKAAYGQNIPALQFMNMMGMKDLDHLKDRLKNPSALLREYLSKIPNLPAGRQADALGFAGIANFMPMIAEGNDKLSEMLEHVQQFGKTEQQIAAGRDFWHHINDLRLVIENLGDNIAIKLNPYLDTMLQKFNNWVNNDAAGWLKEVFDDIKSVTDAVGGLNKALIILGIILARNVILEFMNFSRILIGMVLTSIGFLIEGLSSLTFTVLPRLGLVMVEMGTGLEVFGAAILATPLGWWIAGLAAVGLAVWGVYKAYTWLHRAKTAVDGANGGAGSATGGYDINRALALRNADKINPTAGNPVLNMPSMTVPDSDGIRLNGPNPFNNIGTADGIPQIPASALLPPGGQNGKVDVNVDFSNLPPGVTPEIKSKGNVNTLTNIHYATPLSLNP